MGYTTTTLHNNKMVRTAIKGGLAVPASSNGGSLFLQSNEDEQSKQRRRVRCKRFVTYFFMWLGVLWFIRHIPVFVDLMLSGNSSEAARVKRIEFQITALKTRVDTLERQRKATGGTTTTTASKYGTTTTTSTTSKYVPSWKRTTAPVASTTGLTDVQKAWNAYSTSTKATTAPLYTTSRLRGTITEAPLAAATTAATAATAKKKSLGPLEIDRSGMIPDPLELQALEDLEALVGQGQMTIQDSMHVDYSDFSVQVRYRHVTQISIKRKGLKEVPESIRHLKQLEWLGLEGNQLKTLPDVFNELPKLKTIKLINNPMESLPPSLQHMTRPIQLQLKK